MVEVIGRDLTLVLRPNPTQQPTSGIATEASQQPSSSQPTEPVVCVHHQ
jgi:hypothetical protein